MQRSRTPLFVLAISYPVHACDEATTESAAEVTPGIEAARTHDAEPAIPPPCPPDMALIPPEPGASASVPWFCLDRTEVTVEAWRACVAAEACEPPSPRVPPRRPEWMTWDAKRDDLPINYINHAQAGAFCRWAGKRLPSVAEWSWGYRSASSERNVPWGVWKVGPEEESRVLNAMPTEAVCRPAPNAERFLAPCPVGTSPGDTTKQGISDMVGNVEEWTSSPDERRWQATRPTTGPATQHRKCGDSFRENFFNVPVAGDCASSPSEFAYEDYGVRCASAPAVELPPLSPFPCPTLQGKLRDDALELLHEYYQLLYSGSFDRALSWQNGRIDPRLFAEARLSVQASDADLAELWSVGGGMAKHMLKDGPLAPLVSDADIVFDCDDWKYTPVTHDGRPVLRVDGADAQPLPFCLRLIATGWVVSCIFPSRAEAHADLE